MLQRTALVIGSREALLDTPVVITRAGRWPRLGPAESAANLVRESVGSFRRVSVAAREWWEFLKPPAVSPGPSDEPQGIEPDRRREQQALIDVEVILNETPIAKFAALDIDDVPDEIEIDGQQFRATVHAGPFSQPNERPLYVLLVEPVRASPAPAKDRQSRRDRGGTFNATNRATIRGGRHRASSVDSRDRA
jgi:hypothetical protein